MESVQRRGLIFLPEVSQEKNMLGKIIAVGPGKRDEDGVRQPIEAKVGEVWYFNSKWNDLSPTHYSDDYLSKTKFHLVMEGDLLLRVN
jgi:chaperonin GroES